MPQGLQERCGYLNPPALGSTTHTWAPVDTWGCSSSPAGLRAGHLGWPRLRLAAPLPRPDGGGLSSGAGARRPLPAVPQHFQEQGQLLPVVSWLLGSEWEWCPGVEGGIRERNRMSKSGRVPAGWRSDERGETEGEGRELVVGDTDPHLEWQVRKSDGSRSVPAYAVTPLPPPPSSPHPPAMTSASS